MKKVNANSAQKSPEILIAEDSTTQAEQIKHLLESHNYKVTIAGDGKKAMDWLAEHKPSLVISDIMMPEMNGYELCKEIKSTKTTGQIPVILLTQLSDAEEIIEGLSCGADSFITKPYNEEFLLSHIKKLLIEGDPTEHKKVPFGVEILYKGEKRLIQAEQQNVIKLMLSIYEGAIQQNEKLIQTQEELRLLNERLESLVVDRTSDLTEEIKLSNQITNRLKESEERFRTLYNDAVVGLYRTNSQGKILLANKVLVKMLGFQTQEELATINLNESSIGTNDNRQKFIDQIEKEGEVKNLEAIWICRDGKEIFVRENAKVICDSEGNILFYDGTVEDITERKRLEEERHIALSKYKTLFECFPLGITVSDELGNILETNSTAEKLFNVSQDEQLQRNIDGPEWHIVRPDGTLMPPEEYASVRALKQRCKVENVEMGIVKSKNMITWINVTATPIPLKGYGVVITYNDISDRKRFEESIVYERKMLRTLIDNLPDHIYVKDIEGRKVISNIADFKDFGFQRENQVLGKTDLEIFPFPTGQRGYDAEMEVLTSGKPVIEREEDFIYPDGEKHWSLSTMIPLIDDTGNITGLVGIGHDITERKRVEEELIRAKNKAEESDRLKTAFLHNISHEIRTPMNAIVGFCALLGEPDSDTHSRKDYIEVITQSSNHLLSIITDIIDISNIEADLVKIVKSEINVNSALKSLCNQFTLKANEKKIKLVCESDVPESDALITTDSTKLSQILINLMNNAVKFTDKGYVKIGCMVRERFLEFRVSDTGIGIHEEYHQRIFDHFYQVQHTLSRLYEGTGLGLAITKANVELMGGKIWLTSEPGKGSSFYFTIPYEKQVIDTQAVIEKSVAERFGLPIKKTILVAEDIDSNFKLIVYFLSGANTDIIRAVNGKEAVEKCLSDKNINLVLMDIKMPVMDGYTAVKLIREKNSLIPIIAQTAYADDKMTAIECGCSGFISKPFDKKGLLRVISEFI